MMRNIPAMTCIAATIGEIMREHAREARLDEKIEECLEEYKHHPSEKGAVECIRCLKRNKEYIYWDDGKKRLRAGSEQHTSDLASYMEEFTKILDIKNREDYIRTKNKYNLTMF